MRDLLIGMLAIVILLSIVVISWNVTAYRDVDYLKESAPSFIENRGFTITSYDGHEGSYIHGGFVWYQVRDTNNYLYQMAVGEWRGGLQLYNLECLNAVTNE